MKKQEPEYYKQLEKLIASSEIDIKELGFFSYEENFDLFSEMPCSSYSEFVESPYYLGVGEDTWAKVKEEGDKIWKLFNEGKINEAILLWGSGSGKSYLSSGLSLLFVHYLLCLENPHKFFKLANDKPISVVNMGPTAAQAKNVIFASNRRFVEGSPFFQKHEPEILQTEIRFPRKNICLYCGNSQETMPIGMNVICGVLDEAAWYLDNENKSIAEDIYNTMKNRIISRFGNKGLLIVISAPRYVDDFINRKFQQSVGLDFVYTSSYKTWEVKDRDKMEKEVFDFVVDRDEHGNPVEVWKNIPVDFKRAAESNPEKFMRDFGARPSLVLEAFDRDSSVVEKNAVKGEDPVDENGALKDWFVCRDYEPRYIHVDLGLKKDACGFAMGRLDGYAEVDNERRPRVFIDLIMQIKAPGGGEIKFSEIRRLIYSLKDRGFNIEKVTYDGWQSIDSIQILRDRGINAEVLSVDRDTSAYDTLKELLHTDCIKFRYCKQFIEEYKRLELVKGKKVDHPPKGSKDVCDAVAGVCYSIVKDQDSISSFKVVQLSKEDFYER